MKKLKQFLQNVFRMIFSSNSGKRTAPVNSTHPQLSEVHEKAGHSAPAKASSYSDPFQEDNSNTSLAVAKEVPAVKTVPAPVYQEESSDSTFSINRPPGSSSKASVSIRRNFTSMTGDVDLSLFNQKRVVDYTPNKRFHQAFPQHFPYVLMPEQGTVIKPPVNGKSGNKGMLEESFCKDFLMQYFSGMIFDNLTVFAGATPYEPDLAIIDLQSGKNTFLDIEVDEPYDGVSQNPTHYRIEGGHYTVDDRRNQGFVERGWMVIRFAEEQVLNAPMACCQFIAEVIRSVNPKFVAPSLYFNYPLGKVKMWTYDEAREMAGRKSRETYLGITRFYESQNTRHYTITDSVRGKQMEAEIAPRSEKPKVSVPPVVTKRTPATSRPVVNQNSNDLPVPEKNTAAAEARKQELRKTASDLQSGTKKISQGGAVTTAAGVTSKPHRFHGSHSLSSYKGKMNRNAYAAAYFQKRDIEKKYDFLKCSIENHTLICKGTIRMEHCQEYKIQIESRAGYAPNVFVRNHEITPDPDIHMYPDGSLCLYYPGDMRWKNHASIAETIIPWVFEWIIYYELYKSTGIWEGAFYPHGDQLVQFKNIEPEGRVFY